MRPGAVVLCIVGLLQICSIKTTVEGEGTGYMRLWLSEVLL